MKLPTKICIFLLTISTHIIFSPLTADLSEKDALQKLQAIHSSLSLVHGSLDEEFPEQVMSVMFISENDKVLEIGANVGRNSCVISTILNDSANLVTLESDSAIIPALTENRDLNGLSFQIENSALSHRPLIQKGWVTSPGRFAFPGSKKINTITYDQLKEKYGISFNVLVADCEGALYYILKDDETILDDVKTIIVENDYTNRSHFELVKEQFIAHGFQLVYNKAGGWEPSYNVFYQVWKKP